MRSKTSVPGDRAFIYYVFCVWFIVGVADEMTTTKNYLIFVLLLLLIILTLFLKAFLLVAREKTLNMWHSTAAAATQYLFFDVNILLRVQQIQENGFYLLQIYCTSI